MIIRKMKPHGDAKTISTPIIPTSYHRGKRSEPRPTLFFHLNLFRIWRSSNKTSCSVFNFLQNHILFEIFRVREGIFWTDSNQGNLNLSLNIKWHYAPAPPVSLLLRRAMPRECCISAAATPLATPSYRRSRQMAAAPRERPIPHLA
jgi:hypothetical protein